MWIRKYLMNLIAIAAIIAINLTLAGFSFSKVAAIGSNGNIHAGNRDPYQIFLPIIQNPVSGFYVSNSGLDSNPGTLAAPWRTLQYAVDHTPAGATLFVRGGEYYGFDTSRSNLTLTAYPGESVVIRGNGSDTYTVAIRNASDFHISGIKFQNNQIQYSAGVYSENSTGIIISNNIFSDHRGFGVVTKNVVDIAIQNNDFYNNANAIEIRYGSQNVNILNNSIHDNTRDVDGGRSAVGITLYYTGGPVLISGNRLWGNHTLNDSDPGGAAIEIYAGGNAVIRENVIWDNETVLETGTDGQQACSNIAFLRNVVFRGSRQQGLILRCASNSLFANNTFDALDEYVFYLTHFQGGYGGSIENLKILNNIAVNGRVYSIEGVIPDSVEINHNLLYNPGSTSSRGNYLAYVLDFGNTKVLAEFQSWTGYDLQSVGLPPLFVDSSLHDYRLQLTSPAINIGVDIGEPFVGPAPDAGAFEFSP